MKRKIYIVACLLCFAWVLVSCEKQEPDFFDQSANGAYFDYNYAADFDKTLNFDEYIVGDPDTVSVELKVKLLGYVLNEKRTLAIKTKEVDGYELAKVSIGEVAFANGEYEKNVEVKVQRPEEEDVLYAVCIYIDGSGDIGTGIGGKDSINLYVTESYGMPAVWYSHMETYLGTWSKEKHIFLAKHVKDNHFYKKLYDEETGQHLFDEIVGLNVSAVNALLAAEPSAEVLVDFPIIKESDFPAYCEPYFWSDYEHLLGIFSASKFCRFTTMLGGSNTKDVADLYASETARARMEEEADDFHKDDVKEMLEEYYRYAKQGIAIADFKALYWVEMRNVSYTMRIPYWWEDPRGLGTADIVKKYFGEYSDDKYQFMLKTMMKEDGAANFVAASIFPFVYDIVQDTYTWDQSPFGVKQLAGEMRLKECYRVISAANEKRPPSIRFKDIPVVELD